MINLVVGGNAPKDPGQQQRDAEYVSRLLNDQEFTRLLEECANEFVAEWGQSVSAERDAQIKAKVIGLKEFARYLEIVVQRGKLAGRGPAGPRT
jgi:hypothetical protein